MLKGKRIMREKKTIAFPKGLMNKELAMEFQGEPQAEEIPLEIPRALLDDYEKNVKKEEFLKQIKSLFIDYHIIIRLMNSSHDKKSYVEKIIALKKNGLLSLVFAHPSIQQINYHISIYNIKDSINSWIEQKNDNIYEDIKKALSSHNGNKSPSLRETGATKSRREKEEKRLADKSRYKDSIKNSIVKKS